MARWPERWIMTGLWVSPRFILNRKAIRRFICHAPSAMHACPIAVDGNATGIAISQTSHNSSSHVQSSYLKDVNPRLAM